MKAFRKVGGTIARRLGLILSPAIKTLPKSLFPMGEDGVPVGATFSDIVLVPGTVNARVDNIIDGGPIWPDFERQTWVRMIRKSAPADSRPADPAKVHEWLEGSFVWGGCLYIHFGHLAGENLARILWSLQRWPDATVLFALRPGFTGDALPGYFWILVDWLGLPRQRVRFVEHPVRVSTLHVMPQAETLRGPPPIKSYLDLLDAQVARHNVPAMPSEYLYVSRVGMLSRGAGHAGEIYLQHLLAKLGVIVMDPAVAPFQEQMARYTGARTLIFAEGSALHGRQMLGRIDQRIVVLNRRVSKKTNGESALRARAKEVTVVPCTIDGVRRVRHDGTTINSQLSLYDLPALFDGLKSAGLDVEAIWNEADYCAARDADIADWLSLINPPPPGISRELTLDRVRTVFEKVGVAHMIPKAKEA